MNLLPFVAQRFQMELLAYCTRRKLTENDQRVKFYLSPILLSLISLQALVVWEVTDRGFLRLLDIVTIPTILLTYFATNLSISSSYNKSVKFRLVATYYLQICYNLL